MFRLQIKTKVLFKLIGHVAYTLKQSPLLLYLITSKPLLYLTYEPYIEHCSFAHSRRAFFADIFHRFFTLALLLGGGLAVADEPTTLEESREG